MVIKRTPRSYGRYRDRLKREDKEDIGVQSSVELVKVKDGKRSIYTIPVISIPHFLYGPWLFGGGGGGRGAGPGGSREIEDMSDWELVKYMKDELELEMIKPGKRKVEDKFVYPGFSKHGDDSLLNLEVTVLEMVENWPVKKVEIEKKLEGMIKIYESRGEEKKVEELKKKLEEVRQLELKNEGDLEKIVKYSIENIERDDLRYHFPKIKYRTENDAAVMFIRDCSGSIGTEEMKIIKSISRAITVWLKECYPFVHRIYISHTGDAFEESEEDFMNKRYIGGTAFAPAYSIPLAILRGKDYPRKGNVSRKHIDPRKVDVYVLHFTDGDNFDGTQPYDVLEELFPEITRFGYVGLAGGWGHNDNYVYGLEERFLDTGKLRSYVIEVDEGTEEIWNAMKAIFGKGR